MGSQDCGKEECVCPGPALQNLTFPEELEIQIFYKKLEF